MWDTLVIHVLNESDINFRPLRIYPEALRNATVFAFDGSTNTLKPAYPGYKGRFCAIQCTADGDAAAFVTLELEASDQQLVIWLCISPNHNAAGIRAGIFDKDHKITGEFLDNLDPNIYACGDRGVINEVSIHGTKCALGVAAQLDVSIVNADVDLEEEGNPQAWIYIRDLARAAKTSTVLDTDEQTDFEIAGGFLHKVNSPIHENMSLCALVAANLTRDDITYETVADYNSISSFSNETKTWAAGEFEYIRGVIWNDDPACALFVDETSWNARYAAGVDWLLTFKSSDWVRYLEGIRHIPANRRDIEANQIIYRSHYGDLQFLHSMGCGKDEWPEQTKIKILIWLEVMYKLACGNQGIDAETRIGDTKLRGFFNDEHRPSSSDNLRKLLLAKTPSYTKANLAKRAIGSCFHTIQDSYAVGHCKRVCLNPDDKITISRKPSIIDIGKTVLKSAPWAFFTPVGLVVAAMYNTMSLSQSLETVSFKQGRPGRFGLIQNFHTYHGQDDHKHGLYDTIDDHNQLKPNQPDTFDQVVGGRDSIDKCTKLATFWKERVKWEDGVYEWLDKDVFALAPDCTQSNTEVSI